MKRIFQINILLLFFAFFVEAAIDIPNIELKGDNFKVSNIDNGQRVFLNKTYVFEKTCSDMQSWQFTQINGKVVSDTTFPRADMQLKASSDGYIYMLWWEIYLQRPLLHLHGLLLKDGRLIPIAQ